MLKSTIAAFALSVQTKRQVLIHIENDSTDQYFFPSEKKQMEENESAEQEFQKPPKITILEENDSTDQDFQGIPKKKKNLKRTTPLIKSSLIAL